MLLQVHVLRLLSESEALRVPALSSAVCAHCTAEVDEASKSRGEGQSSGDLRARGPIRKRRAVKGGRAALPPGRRQGSRGGIRARRNLRRSRRQYLRPRERRAEGGRLLSDGRGTRPREGAVRVKRPFIRHCRGREFSMAQTGCGPRLHTRGIRNGSPLRARRRSCQRLHRSPALVRTRGRQVARSWARARLLLRQKCTEGTRAASSS
mmetsp:Transcript_217/g.725  ORF Transcript_217/g.725 Transcript_217/m.725 type:complete len:208 (-) Transcript_217:94-717(-)